MLAAPCVTLSIVLASPKTRTFTFIVETDHFRLQIRMNNLLSRADSIRQTDLLRSRVLHRSRLARDSPREGFAFDPQIIAVQERADNWTAIYGDVTFPL